MVSVLKSFYGTRTTAKNNINLQGTFPPATETGVIPGDTFKTHGNLPLARSFEMDVK